MSISFLLYMVHPGRQPLGKEQVQVQVLPSTKQWGDLFVNLRVPFHEETVPFLLRIDATFLKRLCLV
jgi:hypothetical protein